MSADILPYSRILSSISMLLPCSALISAADNSAMISNRDLSKPSIFATILAPASIGPKSPSFYFIPLFIVAQFHSQHLGTARRIVDLRRCLKASIFLSRLSMKRWLRGLHILRFRFKYLRTGVAVLQTPNSASTSASTRSVIFATALFNLSTG